jgi:hypothetical protein
VTRASRTARLPFVLAALTVIVLVADATGSVLRRARRTLVRGGTVTSVAGALADDPKPRPPREREAVRRTLRALGGGTYIEEMLLQRDSSLARWPDRRRDPIRVWIAPTSPVADWNPAFVGEVRAAFVAWDQLALPARFAFVRDSADAEVVVGWIDHFAQPISGRTRWARDDGWWITDAAITLAVHHHQGERLDEESMRAMALHEVGHLIGLDHTVDPTAIMAPRVRVRELSAADVATARLLYTLPAGAVR